MSIHHLSSSSEFYLLALAVAGPLALWLLHRVGDIVPGLLGFAVAIFDIWVVLPQTPGGCQSHDSTCTQQQGTWGLGLGIVAPMAAIVLYKTARGDKRGQNGTSLP